MATATPADADFDARLSALESRLSRVEGIIEQLNERMASLEQGMAALEQRVGNLESGQRQGFFWIAGIQITTLLTLGTLILVKLG